MEPYLSTQIITYMGNKRKLLPYIENIIIDLQNKKGSKLTIGDGFSGSGIVSRLFKKHASELYTNDIADYSETLNKCYLSNINDDLLQKIKSHINKANQHADNQKSFTKSYVSGNWAPNGKINENTRVYFTEDNGKRIDILRNYIQSIPNEIQPFLIAPLLVECSIHNNTSGHFAAFYKNGKIGQYGGSKNIDLQRITKNINIPTPVFHNNKCKVHITKSDTNKWVTTLPKLDLVYYDPPYNKHPYCIYYFLLDIINNWEHLEIPNTNRGQPLNWNKSLYNSITHAEKTFEDLIKNTNSHYILLSYNNNGIIPTENIEKILKKYGKLEIITLDHKTYNRLKGIANYKRQQDNIKINEFFFLLQK